jgi:hypothetical protein
MAGQDSKSMDCAPVLYQTYRETAGVPTAVGVPAGTATVSNPTAVGTPAIRRLRFLVSGASGTTSRTRS